MLPWNNITLADHSNHKLGRFRYNISILGIKMKKKLSVEVTGAQCD